MSKALLKNYQDTVRKEWIDYNGHLNDGYYAVAFSLAAETFLDYIGLYLDYRAKTQCTIYTVETHIIYLRELKEHAPIEISCRLLGFDTKRIHIFQHMHHAETKYLAATHEVMFLHVNQKGIARASAMPTEALAILETLLETHSKLETPVQAGRKIKLKSSQSNP
jgi:acyl-CoA thioester hydrolase